MNVMGLIQLCAYPEPVGYSETVGVEALVRSGRIRSPLQLEELVLGVLEARIAPADGIASGIAFRAARGGALDPLEKISAALSSERLPAEMRVASVQMGRRLWGVSRGWEWASGVHQQLDSIAEKIELHHAVAFGALVSETTSNQVRAIATYLFQIARNIVLAAVRAIPLDDIAGQRLLSEMQPPIAKLAASCADRSADEIALFPK